MSGGNSVTRPFGVALFGTGRAGTIHFGNIIRNRRCQLQYIIEPNTDAAWRLLNKHHVTGVKVVAVKDVQTVYSHPSVDGVIVCSPTSTHGAIVQAAIQHGKAVFCEKPVCDSPQETALCYDAAAQLGLPLLCSFNKRFDPSLVKLREHVLAGEIGNVHLVKSCNRDHPFPPPHYLSISGGMFHDTSVHDLDIMCWLLGERPVSVYAQTAVHHPDIAALGDVDTIVITLRFPGGVLGIIDISRYSTYGNDQRVEVHGSEGMVSSENQVPNNVVKYNKQGVQGSTYKHSFPQRYADAYTAALDHFLDLLGDKTITPVVGKMDAINVALIVSACEESNRTGLPVNIQYN